AAFDERADLLEVREAQYVAGDGAVIRPVDVRRQRRGAVGRADRAGYEFLAARMGRHVGVGRFAGEARGRDVERADLALELVIRLRDRGGAEGVGLEDVGARLEKRVVDAADDVRP